MSATYSKGDQIGRMPEDIAPPAPAIELAAADPAAVARLRAELGVTGATAQVLARRGYGEPEAARAFIAGGQLLPDDELPGAPDAAALLQRHLEAGTRMAVHGDYDADGVCSTALLVEALTRIGGEVTWHVPDRFADGYGLGNAALERFAADGVGLVIAVDCGVSAVAAVALARELGMDVLVLDHHERGAELPDATIAHPALGGYANPNLCATAVAWKVMRVLYRQLGVETGELEQAAELAGLATVTDVMPLVGENRAIVRRGIEAMRLTPRPGLRELMRVAGVDPLGLDATTFGFRLGPRINAAGRMRSAEAAVELLLTASEQRAAQLADELHGLNAQRQEIEQEVLWQAQQQAERQLDAYAIVVAGEGWHKGVLGIVAGRLAERHRRPCVALAIGGEVAEGSGRSGGRFDLTGGLRACAEHLLTFGGHRAAAGVSLDATRVDAFRAALQRRASEELGEDDLRPRFTAEAVVDVPGLTLAVAEELAALGPFGNANPEPLLLLAGATVELQERMGGSRQHARLTLGTRGGRARAVAFEWQAVKPPGDGPWRGHAVVSLRRNEWRGSVEAQVLVRAIVPLPDSPAVATTADLSWPELFALELAAQPPSPTRPEVSISATTTDLIERFIDRRGEPALAPLLELASGGLPAVVVARRPAAWRRIEEVIGQLSASAYPVEVVDLADLPAGLPAAVTVVLADPPLHADEVSALGAHEGAVVASWGTVAVQEARELLDAQLCSREYVAAFWRLFEGRDELAVTDLQRVVAETGIAWLDAVTAARMARVLSEVELAQLIPPGRSADTIKVVRGRRAELDRSETFRSYSEIRGNALECLSQMTRTS